MWIKTFSFFCEEDLVSSHLTLSMHLAFSIYYNCTSLLLQSVPCCDPVTRTLNQVKWNEITLWSDLVNEDVRATLLWAVAPKTLRGRRVKGGGSKQIKAINHNHVQIFSGTPPPVGHRQRGLWATVRIEKGGLKEKDVCERWMEVLKKKSGG